MYKSHIETERTVKGLMTLEVDDSISTVTVYIGETEGGVIKTRARIKVSVASFFDLIEPVLHGIRNTKGCPPEAI